MMKYVPLLPKTQMTSSNHILIAESFMCVKTWEHILQDLEDVEEVGNGRHTCLIVLLELALTHK